MLFVGDDWAEGHHDIEIVDEAGKMLARKRFLLRSPKIWLHDGLPIVSSRVVRASSGSRPSLCGRTAGEYSLARQPVAVDAAELYRHRVPGD